MLGVSVSKMMSMLVLCAGSIKYGYIFGMPFDRPHSVHRVAFGYLANRNSRTSETLRAMQTLNLNLHAFNPINPRGSHIHYHYVIRSPKPK